MKDENIPSTIHTDDTTVRFLQNNHIRDRIEVRAYSLLLAGTDDRIPRRFRDCIVRHSGPGRLFRVRGSSPSGRGGRGCRGSLRVGGTSLG